MKKIACILLTAAFAAETLPAKAYIPIYDNAGYNEQLGIMTSFSGGISAPGNLYSPARLCFPNILTYL